MPIFKFYIVKPSIIDRKSQIFGHIAQAESPKPTEKRLNTTKDVPETSRLIQLDLLQDGVRNQTSQIACTTLADLH